APFLHVEAGRDEPPDLADQDRRGEHEAEERRDLHGDRERLEHAEVVQRHRGRQRRLQPVEDREAERERHAGGHDPGRQRDEEPLAQLLEVLDERHASSSSPGRSLGLQARSPLAAASAGWGCAATGGALAPWAAATGAPFSPWSSPSMSLFMSRRPLRNSRTDCPRPLAIWGRRRGPNTSSTITRRMRTSGRPMVPNSLGISAPPGVMLAGLGGPVGRAGSLGVHLPADPGARPPRAAPARGVITVLDGLDSGPGRMLPLLFGSAARLPP